MNQQVMQTGFDYSTLPTEKAEAAKAAADRIAPWEQIEGIASGHDVQLGVDHVVGQAAPVEGRRQRARLVECLHVGQQHSGQRLRLGQGLAAGPHRAHRHLPGRDHRGLVGLGVGSMAHAVGGHRLRHLVQVSLEGVEVDEQGRRLDLAEGHPDPGGW